VGTGAPARPSRAQLGSCLRHNQFCSWESVTFAAPPSVLASARSRTTIQQVKSYRTERIKNGIKFTCTHCTHSVTTLDFESKAGNLRTQAATAINHHAAQAHHDPTTVPSRDAELRTSRF